MVWHPLQLKKIKILGAASELPAKQNCHFSPFWPIFVVNGLDWQCYLAGSSKTTPRSLIFSITMGANYSFEMKNIDIWASAFFKHSNWVRFIYYLVSFEITVGHCILYRANCLESGYFLEGGYQFWGILSDQPSENILLGRTY